MQKVLEQKYIKLFITFLNSGHNRSSRAKKNVIASFFIRGGSIGVSFLIIPLTINYVNPQNYGIWVTFSSLIGWFHLFDLGLGNGLRNRLAESIALGDKRMSKVYVSTTYAIIGGIVIIVLFLFVLINPFLDWTRVLNTSPNLKGELSVLALILFSFFCFQFLFKLISTIVIADQKSFLSDLLGLIVNLISLLLIFILSKTTKGSLFNLGFAFTISQAIVLLTASLYLFANKYKYLAPSLKYVDLRLSKDLTSLGANFFIIQISAVILFSVSNILISQLFGPDQVTPYSICLKYFSTVPMVFGIIITPFWSAYTEAFIKHDYQWIKGTTSKLLRIWVVFSVITILMIIYSNLFFTLWVGSKIHIPITLSIFMGIYIIITTFGSIFVIFINGISKIRLQLISSLIFTPLFIPIAILFAEYFKLGISGIILASIVCNIYGPILAPIQYKKIILKSATGLWNK